LTKYRLNKNINTEETSSKIYNNARPSQERSHQRRYVNTYSKPNSMKRDPSLENMILKLSKELPTGKFIT